MTEVNKDQLPGHKFKVKPSKAYSLDRSYRSEGSRNKNISFRRKHMSVVHPQSDLTQISEETAEQFIYKTKYLGGSAIQPVFSMEERQAKFIDPDTSCVEHKSKFREKL